MTTTTTYQQPNTQGYYGKFGGAYIPEMLHRSFGFKEVAHFKQVGYKFGHWLDLTFMQLLLKTPGKPEEN
jgi:tryptophan synthase beta subunit